LIISRNAEGENNINSDRQTIIFDSIAKPKHKRLEIIFTLKSFLIKNIAFEVIVVVNTEAQNIPDLKFIPHNYYIERFAISNLPEEYSR
jgi:hypothetical protein